MTIELIKQFLEAGLHFGHQTKRWNPKMEKYIYGERNGVYIIDLQKTAKLLNNACDFLKSIASKGTYILFVGTKKQAQDIISQEAQRCGMFYVNSRWLGGMLTNFETIKKSVKRLNALQAMKDNGTFKKLSKKEVSHLTQELAKLTRNLSGTVKMDRLPGVLFVIDPKRESNAVKEANRLNVPVVALIDTNCDPEGIEYPIPGNDDAIRAIKFIAKIVTDSIIEGRQEYLQIEEAERLKEEKDEELKKEAKGDKGKQKKEYNKEPTKKTTGKEKKKELKGKKKYKES